MYKNNAVKAAWWKPNRAVLVRAQAREIVLCSWQDTFLSRCLSPPSFNTWGQPCDGLEFHPVDSRITPSCFMLQKPEISARLIGHLARKQTLPTRTMQKIFYRLQSLKINWISYCFPSELCVWSSHCEHLSYVITDDLTSYSRYDSMSCHVDGHVTGQSKAKRKYAKKHLNADTSLVLNG